MLSVPFRDENLKIIWLHVFHLEFAEVKEVWKKVALREGQVLVAEVVEVWVNERINGTDTLLRFVDEEFRNEIDSVYVSIFVEDLYNQRC